MLNLDSHTCQPKPGPTMTDDQLLALEDARARLEGKLGSVQDAEFNSVATAAFAAEDAIRAASCTTALAARLKLEALAREIEEGERLDASTSPACIVHQVIEFLRAA